MIKIFFGTLLIVISFACSKNSDEKIKKELLNLETNQAKVVIDINQKNFYADQEQFSGSGYASNENGIKISMKNKQFGNIIISLEGELNIEHLPLKLSFKDGFPEGSTSGSFLIGKISNASKNAGEGYILTDGGFEITQLDKLAMILKVKGKLRKPFGDSSQSDIDGYIVWNKPELVFNKN